MFVIPSFQVRAMILEAQRLLGLLTALNLGLLWYQSRPAGETTTADSVPGVIRAHALEIVDAQGKVRASIRVLPEDPKVVYTRWSIKESRTRRRSCCA
jgi:hypothetical protein